MLDEYAHIFCDLDGCIVAGNTVLPGANALLEEVGSRLTILSNNSTDTPLTLADKLVRLGLDVAPHQLVLAGTAAVDLMAAESSVQSVCIFGTHQIKKYADAQGLDVSDDVASHVLLCRDLAFDYEGLCHLVALLHDGAALTVANIDRSHPGPGGVPVPETGALLSALQACIPDLRYRAIGKPEPHLFELALTRARCAREQALMIGDNPTTDGLGAQQAGLAHVLIGTDESACAPDLATLLAQA